MKHISLTIVMLVSFLFIKAQPFLQDPAANGALIMPSPLATIGTEFEIEFSIGNNGFDAITGMPTEDVMTFVIDLQKCAPSIGGLISLTGIDALSGDALDYFDVTYDDVLMRYTFIQKAGESIMGMQAMDIIVSVQVTELSANPSDISIGAVLTITPHVNSLLYNEEDNDVAEALTYTMTTLPVIVDQFTGVAKGCNVVLTWKTKSEEDFAYFDVEYSADGVNFSILQSIQGKNSTAGSTYQHTIAQAATHGYYRLKIVDKNKKFVYSHKILQVRTQCNAGRVMLAPNPVTSGIVTVRGLSSSSHIQVLAVDGKQLLVIAATTNSIDINMTDYRPGTYFIRVLQKDMPLEVFKIVKE